MGASRTGGRSTASPGSARRKPLTQLISRNSRPTCRNASAMPISTYSATTQNGTLALGGSGRTNLYQSKARRCTLEVSRA